MPFLHLDAENKFKDVWKDLVKDHPAHFEILEWTNDQDRDHLYRSQPELDTQLYPRICVSIVAALQKLVDYGGIVVRGQETRPIRGVRILLEDWKIHGPPSRLTVRGYIYPVILDKTTIMSCSAGDPICIKYRDLVIAMMLRREWIQPEFDSDVAIF